MLWFGVVENQSCEFGMTIEQGVFVNVYKL